jgi:glycolate oxidase iron-sulfur subunit
MTLKKQEFKMKEKLTQQQKIESANALEEASEILEKCIKCGMCKGLCPVFKSLKEEELSPRGQAILLQNKILQETIFQCNLCKACETKCPLNLKICDAIIKARESLSIRQKNIKTNEEMIKNVRKTGNPFGGKKPEGDKLYCC